MPFLTPFLGEGSPTKIDDRTKIGHPSSNLSNRGPSKWFPFGQKGVKLQVASKTSKLQPIRIGPGADRVLDKSEEGSY